jgi:uracil-DNA glycosylase family 4
MIPKNTHFQELMDDVKQCTKCKSIKVKRGGEIQDCGLINFIADPDTDGKVPTIWTDWFNRLDAKVAVIGQDWGPISGIRKYVSLYENRLSERLEKSNSQDVWNEIVRDPDSMTSRYMIDFFKQSAAIEKVNIPLGFMDSIFVTNAVLCSRKGEHFRGNHNFDAKTSTRNCLDFLQRQIMVVKPLVIVSLGGWSLWGLSQIFNFEFNGNLTAKILEIQSYNPQYIKVTHEESTFSIVPIFHPAAMRSKKDQIEDYRLIWRALKDCLKVNSQELVEIVFSKTIVQKNTVQEVEYKQLSLFE